MVIRKSTEHDLERIMEIYAVARRFMVEHGNPNQWSSNNWPPQELISQDITRGNSYVCIDDGKVVGTFFFAFGKENRPSRRLIFRASILLCSADL